MAADPHLAHDEIHPLRRLVTGRGSLAKGHKQQRCKGVFNAGTLARGPLVDRPAIQDSDAFAPLVRGPLCLFARDPRPVTGSPA